MEGKELVDSKVVGHVVAAGWLRIAMGHNTVDCLNAFELTPASRGVQWVRKVGCAKSRQRMECWQVSIGVDGVSEC